MIIYIREKIDESRKGGGSFQLKKKRFLQVVNVLILNGYSSKVKFEINTLKIQNVEVSVSSLILSKGLMAVPTLITLVNDNYIKNIQSQLFVKLFQ